MVTVVSKTSLTGILADDLRSIRTDFFPYLFLFLQLVYFSGLVRQFMTDEFLVLNIIFSFLLCVFNKRLTSHSFRVIAASLFAFLILNVISSFVFGFNLRLVAGYAGRVLLGYLIVILLRDGFFERFEKLVTVLAVISLPLFIIQIFYPDFFNLFDSVSNSVLIEARLEQSERNLYGHKYLFVFLFNGWASIRNSGFMWEPAAFGAILSWAAIFNIIRNNFIINYRIYIFLIAALTTFSLGTYVYLTGLMLFLTIKNYKSTSIRIMFFIGVIIILGYQLSFTSENINMMSEKIEAEVGHRERALSGKASETEISRLAAFEINFNYFKDWPFGYGLAAERNSELKYLGASPNGLMKILVTWGIFGMILIIWSVLNLIKFLGRYYSNDLSLFYIWGLTILFIIPISGNPFYNQPFLFSLLFGIWIIKAEKCMQSEKMRYNKQIQLYKF